MKTQDLKSFLQRWLINTLAVLVAVKLVHGIRYETNTDLLVATLVLGILNSFLRPLLMLISLPLLIFTLGLFTLVINALLLYFVGNLVTGFHVVNFKSAFWGALVISVVSFAVNTLTGVGKSRIHIRRSRPPGPKPPPDDGGGPVIDV
ncbi:MAG: phage holin family protein [Verrucomicrobia bacterium]|nr:phage holin family protein [Verrucomicrobiota bacterium]